MGRTRTLSLALVAVAIAVASWALIGEGERPPEPSAAFAAEPAGPPAFRYVDDTDRLLFRTDPSDPAAVSVPIDRHGGVPIRISRHAALAAARRGALDVALPDGRRYPVDYERSENAPGGNWTFIGRVDTDVGNLAAVITFGRDGVFGLLPTPDGGMMQVTTRAGQAFVQPAGGIIPAGGSARYPDYSMPPTTWQVGMQSADGHATEDVRFAGGNIMQTEEVGGGLVTIDLLAAYTTNLVQLRGSVDAARTEFHNLVAIANQAHADSGSRARFAIVGYAEIDYPADGWNVEAMGAMRSGYLPDGTDIHALRDSVAADLVALIRPHAAGDPTCGSAWIPGGGLLGYRMGGDYAYSVAAVEGCGPLVLAHELGHNLGLVHDRESVIEEAGRSLSYGAFHFSFGFKQDGPAAFATVMAYDTAQHDWIGIFSHPGTILCNGGPCGIHDRADSVRSINLAVETIAGFRDPLETLSILDRRVLESDDGSRDLRFTVRASSPVPAAGVTFDIVVTGGTATRGTDWELAPGVVLSSGISGGSSSKSFEFTVFPDTDVEGDETIEVRLENVQGMAVHDATAVGIIQDDDPRLPVHGRLRLPEGEPTDRTYYVSAQTKGLGLPDWGDALALEGPDFLYEVMVPINGSVELSPSTVNPLISRRVRIVDIEAPIDGLDLSVVHGVTLSGRMWSSTNESFAGIPATIWNPWGDGAPFYLNFDTGFYESQYAYLVFPGVPMRIESDGRAPYSRQVIEVPPLYADATIDIEFREQPSLTIAHESVEEGDASDGSLVVEMTAELSEPAPAGGITFSIAVSGTAGKDDYGLAPGPYAIPEGATSVAIPVAVHGDNDGETDEILHLHVADIQGNAWNPGPGSVRILTDEVRPGDGRCTGSTAAGGVRMCQ